MTMLTVRGLDPEVKAKLQQRAARRGRSMEAEVRSILARAVEEDLADEGLGDAIIRIFGDLPPDALPDLTATRTLPRGIGL
ncbi:FitA-like ribbon-helix-helix domain-containing protein [Nocardioides sp. AE5]|uniref:FitA-like ribbon-helix-helix domain-containing protein n=1 Tax=Nocardioides sp. AE5 TaxID=2962573 RepID=UPI0028825BF7|nr:hypothetical protein [Nocardioides sp. AE5]MDT0202037.1 hypothetical protein [Nocardioides sp. AE5]